MRTKLLLAALTIALASCSPLPEGSSNPLNTPGDRAHVPYVDSDIHWRMFASDYGHR